MNSMFGSTGFRGATGSNSGRNMFKGDVTPRGFKTGQLQQFTPEQMQLFKQMMGDVGQDSYLSQLAGGDESLFNDMEAPAMRQFSELQGGLASRFSGQGMGARKSSGFQNTSSAAASNFAQDLASRRQDLQRQALQDLFGMREHLLGQKPYERFMSEKPQKEKSGWGSFLGAGLGGLGGFLAGGPSGALTGASIGSRAGGAF